MTSQLCSEINGRSCKNKVSARNGYICAAGHGRDSAARPTIPISNMGQGDRRNLARNTEDEAIQMQLFRTKNIDVQSWLALNPSIGRDVAIELAKVGEAPFGYTQNKSLAELLKPENLSLIKQYPETFSRAYLVRLLSYSQEDKEESKALTLHSYLVNEKNEGARIQTFKDWILHRYASDQEVALIVGSKA